MTTRDLSPSALALAELLDSEPDTFRGIGLHRTVLWNFRTGRRKPDARSIAILDRITGGRVAANGWCTEAELEAKPNPTAA